MNKVSIDIFIKMLGEPFEELLWRMMWIPERF